MITHILKLIWNKKEANLLIILEIFLAFFILCAVLVFVIYNLQRYNEPLGYKTANIWVANINWPPDTDSSSIGDTKTRILQEIAMMPDILEASYCMSATMPLGGGVWTMSDRSESGLEYLTHYMEADEKFADLLELDVVEGRWFDKSDQQAKYPPIVINQKLRDELFKDTVALGQILKISGERSIIGVIKHLKYYGEFGEEPNISITNLPVHSTREPVLIMKIRPQTEAAFEEEINRTLHQLAKDWKFTIFNLDSRRQSRSHNTWVPLIALLSVSAFLILNVAMGLFGVLWQNIQKRRGEIGLRQAMGATRMNIYAQFIIEMLMVTTLGVLLGLLFTIQLPLLKVVNIDHQVFMLALFFSALIIYGLVILCSFYPSHQASLIRPAVALHEE